ncbi:RHS repeat-associated core domain-containing protein [Pseudomonas syringae]|uniref:RHS repeat-associated core domain-containing protein n=3 Tax=Pseudomonas TaxID=286 RepID=UPI0030B86ACF
MRRKTWQYATTLPAEKLSQIQNPLIKPERYVEHAYNPLHRRYEYDPAGELSRTLDKLRGEVTYEYEANGRLLEHNPEKRFDGEEFRYDAAGNRLNFNTSRFDRVKDNRLKQWSNHEYKYDAWGNLVEKIVGIVRWQTFTYDSENRLVKTETMANSQVESTSSYQYDSLGRRVGKQSEIKGKTDHRLFLWQGLRLLREESLGQSSLYLYEPGSYAPLARVDQREGEVENRIYYFHTDQIGTPLEMTDAEGQIVWQAKYRPWGAIEKLVVNEVEQNLRFQGQYFDVETGLHYNTFRYYDPEIGRFITQDPIGLAGGLNLYQYAPSPIAWTDPLGWSCWSPRNVAGRKVYQRNDLFDPSYTDELGRTNIQRMRKGEAPIGKDGSEVNLHHLTQDEPGSMAEILSSFHSKNDRVLHMYSNQWDKSWVGADGSRRLYASAPSSMNRGPFNTWKKSYWKQRSLDF